MLQLEAVEDVS